MLLSAVALLTLLSCSPEPKHSFSVSEGYAVNTLKVYASQAQVEILFDPTSVRGIKTNALVGSHDTESALEIMTRGTPLKFNKDPKTGAYAILLDISKVPEAPTKQVSSTEK
ncbi:MAG: STN domain-containing protein [Opitutales bacterium]|nr:STN domain-containing protein [Opitutales bacterium]